MMIRSRPQILQDINNFEPTRDGSWLGLEALLSELWKTQISQGCLSTLFRVFERFPEEDGAGVFWSIVHGIESTNLAYEAALQASLERLPSEFAELMINRLKKSR
ncbi:hypothetical protein [Rugamonas sp. DEMB1]|uniref:hypothetical protein n=1 Tax=Rugamonas sp. DEMB1 TaxID=3039386 RepID=UPI002446A9F7|nr:hypothetical protein [Rugamonas sp. DEMB1]WGG53223.1 hypothetical protein QC826_14600 [Rugamonas sp. DEMB1]